MLALTSRIEWPRHDFTPRGARLLLIHENVRQLAYHHAVLTGLGCTVTDCDSYDGGLRMLSKGPWELVIVSQGTAAFEGRRVLERAIEPNCFTPVVILSRLHDMPAYLTAMYLGAVDYVEEPLEPSEWARVISSYARSQALSAG